MSLLNQIALSGLRVSQIGMAITGQNIANVNTPGFSRLTAMQSSVSGSNGLLAGGGVEVNSIRRMTSNFLTQQVWRANTEKSYYSQNQDYLSALEGLMAEEGSSISSGLDRFFAVLNEATTNPSSIALRQQVLAEAGNLSQRFNGLGGNIETQLQALQEQRKAMVTEINGLSANIAQLNKKIAEAEATKGDASALKDQRETLIKDLSQYAKLRVQETADGSVNVSLASGQPLVSSSTPGRLEISINAAGEQEINLAFLNQSFPLNQDQFGGALGGLYDAEHSDLRATLSTLQDMAGELATLFNNVITTGFDLNGNAGQALFVFDGSSTSNMLQLNNLTAEELAFSSVAGEVGNNDVLLELLETKHAAVTINGNSIPITDIYASMLGEVASRSRQNQADLDTSSKVSEQAQMQRDSVSAVSLDEEGVNLMTYQQAYEANMKVISTARELFDTMLAAF